jgi:hypothetical protein
MKEGHLVKFRTALIVSVLFAAASPSVPFGSGAAFAQGDDGLRKKCRALVRADLGLGKGADGKNVKMPKGSRVPIDKCVANGGKL